MNKVIPTSDMESFKKQLNNPNVGFDNVKQEVSNALKKTQKNLVISVVSDYTGCGHIRNILPSTYLNAVYGPKRNDGIQIITTPIVISDPSILNKTRSILFQRTMGPQTPGLISHFKDLQKKYRFKMIYDIDDFVWSGDDTGEEIPSYNTGKDAITLDVQESSIENMKMMDIVCVSTQFLKDYIIKRGIEPHKVKVVHNSLPTFLWGKDIKKGITERITKPRVVWSSSPTHWFNEKKLCGDMENAWRDWVIKSVKEDKIEYIQMGGLPWFFEEIKDKIKVYSWVNSLHYPQALKSINADFGIAPLVPNYFNYSKSAIKYQEYCISGILGIGSVFTNGNPSPYDICLTKANDNITVEEIDELFDKLVEPQEYNRIITEQYKQVIDNSWITESAGYINLLTSIL